MAALSVPRCTQVEKDKRQGLRAILSVHRRGSLDWLEAAVQEQI
jgi:hypothetical protein